MNELTTTLIATEEQSIDFYGDKIRATLIAVNDEIKVYIVLRDLCKHLGLSWSGQFERTNRDPVLSQEVLNIWLPSTNFGGNSKFLCLPIEFLNGWLFGIAPKRVKPEIALKLLQYKRECFRVLWQHFQTDLALFRQFSLLEKTANTLSHKDLFHTEFAPTHQHLTQIVRRQCDRAERIGLPATLTLQQWIQTLDAFGWYCAYCQEKPSVIIEHFIPLSLGSQGTTQSNCVPSCFSCNSKKGNKHPRGVTLISREVLESVQIYLRRLEEISSMVVHGELLPF